MDKTYVEIVRLLLECAPAIFESSHLAMKGGTAINLFVQDMPRLSVDIDVVFTDYKTPRDEALKTISKALDDARKRLGKSGVEAEISATKQGEEIKLFIRRGSVQVKVEVNHVFRGTILPVEKRQLHAETRKVFTTDLTLPILAANELYGSKLVAALDRQHPRDLFDVRGLFQSKGFSDDVVECFVCYLAGHNRPVHEVLFSHDQDLSMIYESEFQGMTRNPVTLEELLDARARLRKELSTRLTSNHKQFLIGLVSGNPDWQLMKCGHLAQLPAIKWKIQNLTRLQKANPRKFAQQADELRVRFV